MPAKISARLSAIVDALPIKNGQRILEIGCGSGVAAREIIARFPKCFVLGIDRSPKAVDQARQGSKTEISGGQLDFIESAIEEFSPPPSLRKFDFAFAVRVGALDQRHPEIEKEAIRRIRALLKPGGKIYIDGGDPLSR